MYQFTAPYACYVKIEACMLLYGLSSGPIKMDVYKKNFWQHTLCQATNGYSYQTAAGCCVVLCAAGDTLEIRSVAACTTSLGNVIYTIR